MNFMLDDNSIDKVYDIFERIEEKLNIDLSSFVYESSSGDGYLKATVSDKTLFEKDGNSNINPGERTKCVCNVALQIQSVYYNMKDKDIIYYLQVLLKECSYEVFLDNRKINPRPNLRINLNLNLNLNLKKRLMKIL